MASSAIRRQRRLARGVTAPGFFSPTFSDASDFVSGATLGTSLTSETLPRTGEHQSLVQQELERAKGISYETRAFFPQSLGAWGPARPPYRSAPARVLDLALRKRNVVGVRGLRRVLWTRSPPSRIFLPRKVSVCLSRRARREVLFAFGVGGSRGLGRRGVRRTFNSQWSC